MRNDINDSFFWEMAASSTDKAKILLNYFSRKPEEYDQWAQDDMERFRRTGGQSKFSFEIADPDKLGEQLKRCSIMYMKGGDTSLLLGLLSRTQNLRRLFAGKVIAGSSAGVNILSRFYWSDQREKIMEGLGILNIKVKCHFSMEDAEIVKKLLAHKEDLPLLTLPEYHWVVMYR